MDDVNNTTESTVTIERDAKSNQDQTKRDEKGRFSKGNRGGPGNPFARQTAMLRQAALEAVTAEDMRKVMNALKEKAAKGDVPAIRLLLSYTVGKPTVPVDPDSLDQHEMQTIVNNHVRSQESILHVGQGMPIEALLTIFRAMLPELLESKMQQCLQVLKAPPGDEDDDDDLEKLDDAIDAENAAAAAVHARNDNIPAWMYEKVNANRAVPQQAAAEKPQRPEERHEQHQKTLDHTQNQIQELLNKAKAHYPGADELESGQKSPVHWDLMRSLIERMKGKVAPPDDQSPP